MMFIDMGRKSIRNTLHLDNLVLLPMFMLLKKKRFARFDGVNSRDIFNRDAHMMLDEKKTQVFDKIFDYLNEK